MGKQRRLGYDQTEFFSSHILLFLSHAAARGKIEKNLESNFGGRGAEINYGREKRKTASCDGDELCVAAVFVLYYQRASSCLENLSYASRNKKEVLSLLSKVTGVLSSKA